MSTTDEVSEVQRSARVTAGDTRLDRAMGDCRGFAQQRQHGKACSRSCRPNPAGSIVAHRNDPDAVRAEGAGSDRGGVPLECPDLSAGPQVPDLERFVPAGREQPIPIGTKGARFDGILMALEAPEFFPILRVPDLDDSVLACVSQPGAFGTIGAGPNRLDMADKPLQFI